MNSSRYPYTHDKVYGYFYFLKDKRQIMAANFLLDLKRIISSLDSERLVFAPLPFDVNRYGNSVATCAIDESALASSLTSGLIDEDSMGAFTVFFVGKIAATLLNSIDIVTGIYATSMEELCIEIDMLEYLTAPLLFTNVTTNAQHIGRIGVDFPEFAQQVMSQQGSSDPVAVSIGCTMQIESRPIELDESGKVRIPLSTTRENYKFAKKVKDFGGYTVAFLDPSGVKPKFLEDLVYASEEKYARSYDIDFLREFKLHTLPLLVSEITFKSLDDIFESDTTPDFPTHVLHSPASALQ